MIYGLAREVGAELKAKGYPFHVLYGPELYKPTSITNTRIVIERDRRAGDAFLPTRSQHLNPRQVGTTSVGAVLRIYANATVSGAALHDHETLADHLRRAVRVAIDDCVKKRQTLWRISSGKFLSKEELELGGLEQWPGAVYELRFSVDDGDADVNYAGEARPEIALGPGGVPIESTTEVAQTASAAPPETACGGD